MVVEAMPNALFRVQLSGGRHVVAHIAGETRMRTVRLVPGERVTVEVTAFDPSRGRIVGKSVKD
jgi:translation initiation factor IF-1